MKALPILVDFDNLDARIRAPGPIAVVRSILACLPSNLLFPYDVIKARLYGGWRTSIGYSTPAQDLIPDLEAGAPTILNVTHIGQAKTLRVDVTLATGPIGTRKIFPDTLVKDRDLRLFRARPFPWGGCANEGQCGFAVLRESTYRSRCQTHGCGVQINDVLVRNEQKMVDTLLVADIAQQALGDKADEVVVVSSDVDIWPGIFLALQYECRVTHVHTSEGWRTPKSLTDTLSHPLLQNYRELSL